VRTNALAAPHGRACSSGANPASRSSTETCWRLIGSPGYRGKYDAERTIERFAGRMRDAIELDALTDELRSVVGETVQPAHVSLWLRDRP
jgi:hypothetical protein